MGAISNMFSGYLQAALYTGLNGAGGLAGWQWLFIFDGIIGIPIAVWGFWAIPDLPSNTRAFWLNIEVSPGYFIIWWCRDADVHQEREYGVKRMERIGRAPPKKLTWKVIKRVYSSWQIWAFIFPYL
jgi:MFS transporter, ACS family, pantothenate transporter